MKMSVGRRDYHAVIERISKCVNDGILRKRNEREIERNREREREKGRKKEMGEDGGRDGEKGGGRKREGKERKTSDKLFNFRTSQGCDTPDYKLTAWFMLTKVRNIAADVI